MFSAVHLVFVNCNVVHCCFVLICVFVKHTHTGSISNAADFLFPLFSAGHGLLAVIIGRKTRWHSLLNSCVYLSYHSQMRFSAKGLEDNFAVHPESKAGYRCIRQRSRDKPRESNSSSVRRPNKSSWWKWAFGSLNALPPFHLRGTDPRSANSVNIKLYPRCFKTTPDVGTWRRDRLHPFQDGLTHPISAGSLFI